ncbi:MAG TPA: FecR domain-containing protein, partial [Arenibacter sp.]|nr:FecR domain-containing protein [Arenibacter sp.]
MTNKTEIRSLLEKFVQNQCTTSEIGILVDYFKETTSHDELPTVEEVVLLLDKIEEMDTSEEERIFDSIIISGKEKALHTRKLVRKKRFFLKYAAVVVILIGLSSLFYFQSTNIKEADSNNISTSKTADNPLLSNGAVTLQLPGGNVEIISEDQALEVRDNEGNVVGKQSGNQLVYGNNPHIAELTYNKLTVPFGKKFELFLSDGTRVYLNAGSSIKYPVKFIKGQDRSVFLMGEAFFDVIKDTGHPFIIHTDELNIRVLGTKFNVSTYPEDTATDVVLVEGSVGLYEATDEFNAETFLLEPGFMGSYDKKEGKLVVEAVPTSAYTSWMDGELVFRNM